jgi:cellulose synthase (UDP-forming)
MFDKSLRPGKLSNSALVFLILAPIIIFNYLIFILNPNNAGSPIAYSLQLTADLFSIITVSGLWFTILVDALTPAHQRREGTSSRAYLANSRPTIDVLVPVAGEPIELVRKTLSAAIQMDYPHKVFVLDDGKSDEVKALATQLGAGYICRPDNRYAKSGNINYGLKHSTAEYFAILDADFIPKSNFITALLGYMVDPKLAFVQSPQSYSNMDNFIAQGTASAQEIFYRYVLPAKNSSESSFCVGTNVIFRRQAIDEIGGMFELDHSEDIWTSLTLHEHGWKSLYIGQILAIGQAPDNIISYFKQQKRWAQGGFTIFFHRNPLLSSKLTTDQRIQYMYTTLFYFIGISITIYLILPLIYLFFGLTPIHVTASLAWSYHYIPYLAIFYALPSLLIGRLSLAAIATSLAVFSSYVEAFLSTIFSNRYVWVTTSSEKAKSGGLLTFIWPHLLIISLSIGAAIMGWFAVNDIVITTINCFWALLNAGLLSAFLIYGTKKLPNKDIDEEVTTGQQPSVQRRARVMRRV